MVTKEHVCKDRPLTHHLCTLQNVAKKRYVFEDKRC